MFDQTLSILSEHILLFTFGSSFSAFVVVLERIHLKVVFFSSSFCFCGQSLHGLIHKNCTSTHKYAYTNNNNITIKYVSGHRHRNYLFTVTNLNRFLGCKDSTNMYKLNSIRMHTASHKLEFFGFIQFIKWKKQIRNRRSRRKRRRRTSRRISESKRNDRIKSNLNALCMNEWHVSERRSRCSWCVSFYLFIDWCCCVRKRNF